MKKGSGWQPLGKPSSPAAPNPQLTLSPFGRLARTHALGATGDGAVALALAGSIFFNVSPSAARTSIALYLVLTIAPFAVVTPLIGPLIDRMKGGRRGMVMASLVGRLVLAVLMVRYVNSLVLFPLAFGLLVLQKAYAVAKSAMVPRLVASPRELVEANSKLALLSAISGTAGVAVASLFNFLGGAQWAMALAALVYAVGAVQSVAVPKVVIADEGPADVELAEVRGATIRLAGSAMALQRAFIGFVTFLLAFNIRGGDQGIDLVPEGAAVGVGGALALGRDVVSDPPPPFWHFGVVAAAAAAGALIGARMAPVLRNRVKEEWMLLGSLVLSGSSAAVAALTGGIGGAFVIALGVSVAVASGKLAFDSLVQRDAPDANYGRWFATFEARFQLAWVIGAFLPVIIAFRGDTGVTVGYTVVAVAGLVAALLYFGLTRPRFAARLRRMMEPARARAGRRRGAPPAPGAQPPSVDHTSVIGDPPVVDDLTSVFGDPPAAADDTAILASPAPTATDGVSSPDAAADEPAAEPPAPAAPWGDPVAPTISSVDGVEIDEPLR